MGGDDKEDDVDERPRRGKSPRDVRRGDRKKGDQEEDIEEYWFVCKRWFAKDEDDGKIVRELLPTDENGNPLDVGLKGIIFYHYVYLINS